ncbi:MAG: ABC-2 family transporter protein [Vallitaleaceae bacterium]|jgi:ABC-2 type transport system permease protein|nr:ABC-2 family transporter protein [Vallitaleaceae bacterium]
MSRNTGYLKLYGVGLKVGMANIMAYRGDFFINFFIMLMAELFAPIITFLIYRSGAAFPGWTLEEVMMIQGVFLLSKGIGYVFFFGLVDNTLFMVREGTFDLLLIKPRPVLFMSLVSGINVGDLGSIFSGLGVFILAATYLSGTTLMQWLLFLALFVMSLTVMLAFSIIMGSTVIKWVGNGRVYEIFEAISSFGLYPKSIYGKAFANIISFIIPLSIIGFIPAAVLLGRPVTGIWISVIVSILFLILSTRIWKMMMKYYTSAGG